MSQKAHTVSGFEQYCAHSTEDRFESPIIR